MKEKDLVLLWKSLSMQKNKEIILKTKDGKQIPVKVLFPGEFNINEGPDFQNAKLIIQGKEIVGDIEFHIHSLDWFKHRHFEDEKYNRVVLHIVLSHNSKFRIENKNKVRINTLIIDKEHYGIENISNLNENHLNIYTRLPCFYLLMRKSNKFRIPVILQNAGKKNLLAKIKRTFQYYNKCITKYNNIWETFNQVLYLSLLRAFGYEKNKYGFEKYGKDIEYKEYVYLIKTGKERKLYKMLKPYIITCRTRPCNFPYIRFNQFLNLIKNTGNVLFKQIMKIFICTKDFNQFAKKFQNIINLTSTHKIGTQRVKIILYNAIFPVLYLYFKVIHNYPEKNKLITYWLQIKGFENNHIIKKMHKLLNYNLPKNLEIYNQGLMYLYRKFCMHKKCEECELYKKLSE